MFGFLKSRRRRFGADVLSRRRAPKMRLRGLGFAVELELSDATHRSRIFVTVKHAVLSP